MKADKSMKITLKRIESTQEEFQQRLDDAFDLLFDEVVRLLDVSKSQNLFI